MPITAITIENFKAIKEPVRIELKPITLLFGPNSAGKSTIVQALHYAREIFERQNVDPDHTLLGGDCIDLGGFESIVHRHDKGLPIKIRVDLNLENESLPTYLDGYEQFVFENESPFHEIPSKIVTAWVDISIEWSNLLSRPLVKRYNVGLNGKELAEINTSDDGRQIFISRIEPFNPLFLKEIDSEEAADIAKRLLNRDDNISESDREKVGILFWQLLALFDVKSGVPGLTRPLNLLDQQSAMPRWSKALFIDPDNWNSDTLDEYENQQDLLTILSILIVGPGELVRDALRKICYLGPLRIIPPRNFVCARTPDESRWANGMAAWDILFNEEDQFREKVNRWLGDKEQFNTGYRVVVKKYKELDVGDPLTIAMMRDSSLDEETSVSKHIITLPISRRLLLIEEASNIEVQPLDIGVGISQVLPVIIAALNAKTGFVVIEQPELHIHPALQVVLGDLFIEQIHECPSLTFILETHSEHLMLRLLRRIRETNEKTAAENKSLKPEELSIYFIERGEEGITCQSIQVDQDGDFVNRWPRGFFGERAEELF